MKNRITKRFAMLAILCVLIVSLAAPALAASYSKVYGQTQDKLRVRESASASATVIDNIVKGACVYITNSKTSGSNVFVKVNYRNSDGDIDTGWVCQTDGSSTYVKVLSAEQAKKNFSVSSGNLPSTKVGTFTAAQRKSAAATTSSSASGSGVSAATIKNVQTMLKDLGYYTGDITGNVGTKTEAAIKAFQSAYSLTVDGIAGPVTVAKLESVHGSKSSSGTSSSGSSLKLGSSGDKVRNLQQDLTTLGYYWADITGNFGSKTEAAVKSFQQKNNLTADGVAGTKTLNAIADAISRKGGSSSSGSGYTSGTTLRLNSQGTAVSQLQTDLKQLGYYYADITGNFGTKTEAAVKEFQEDKGLTADGIAGYNTLQAVSKAITAAGGSASGSGASLTVGSTGEKVRQLQQDLTALGYYYGDISGHYGSLTQAAVKKFQKDKGITQDGVAGTTTLNAISKALGGSSSSSSSTSLREGDQGSAVLELQTMLKELSYYYGDLTGSFGSLTKNAVRKFQDDNDLTVDGIAGTKTLSLLRSMTGRTSGDSTNTGSVTSSTVAEKDSYFLINQDGVRLRTTYSLSSAAKTTMDEGKPVQATRKYNVGGTIWYYITVKKSSGIYSGYVRAKVLDNVTKEVFIANGGNVGLDAANAEILGMIRITGNNVSIREYNDSDSTKVASANKGDVFYYIKKSGSWYQLQSGYWVKSDYAVVMSDDEVNSYLGSSSTESYREGDEGSMVLWIQQTLHELDYYDGDLSGHYGSKTKEAVRKFQKDYGLGADGIAGPKTIAALMAALSSDSAGSGSGTAKYNGTIYNIDWFENRKTIVSGTYATVTDIFTGKTFEVKHQNGANGNHADVEPRTKSDTEVLCSLYGVANSSQLVTGNKYQRRAVVLTNSNGYQFVGSIYAIPHGSDTVAGNDFDGQFCIHFRGSTIHEGDGGSVNPSENHQAMIEQGVEALESVKDENGNYAIYVEENRFTSRK